MQIKEKQHDFFCDAVVKLARNTERLADFPSVWKQNGNCIPCALSHLLPDSQSSELRNFVSNLEKQPGSWSYRELAQRLRVNMQPLLDADFRVPGQYLLHADNDGRAHCVAASVEVNNEFVKVWDGDLRISIGVSAFQGCLASAVDGQIVLGFAIDPAQPWQHSHKPFFASALDTLLDLRARATGASASGSDAGSSDEGCFASETKADDSIVRPGPAILGKLKAEVEVALTERFPQERGKHRCPLYPFRAFGDRKQRVEQHLAKHHVAKAQYCPSGTKQVKLVLALHDEDCMQSRDCQNYLRSSAELLRMTVCPPLPPSRNSIDARIRLVYTATDPEFRSLASIVASDTEPLRRVRNIYYTQLRTLGYGWDAHMRREGFSAKLKL